MITDIRMSSGTVTFRDCNNLRLPENEHALSETGLRPDETEFIDLTDIPVAGDIKVFSAFSGLKSIRISGTDIFGDLKIFSRFTRLEELSAKDTSIAGKLTAISSECLSLKIVELSNCVGVSGDINVINKLGKLKVFRADRTALSGVMTGSIMNKISKLREEGPTNSESNVCLDNCSGKFSLPTKVKELQKLDRMIKKFFTQGIQE